jgi:hypothetical protein
MIEMRGVKQSLPGEPRSFYFATDPRMMSPAQLQAAIAAQAADDYDQELDNPLTRHPEVAQLLREMRHRYLKSSNQNVEMALMQWEMSYNHEGTRRQRWPGQRRWQGKEAEEMRLVQIMHPYKFLRKLREVGVDARVEEHKNARLWLNPFTLVGRIGVNARVCGEAMTVTSLQYPYGPEYSIMRFNDYDVPTEERFRGWRTALLCLIVSEVITQEEAEKAFGPAVGPASEFYREQLQINRRVKMGLQI